MPHGRRCAKRAATAEGSDRAPHVNRLRIQVLTHSFPCLKWRFLCGNSSVGRARPCQGRGREFESRFPLQFHEAPFAGLRFFRTQVRCVPVHPLSRACARYGRIRNAMRHPAGWQSGYAADCKSAYAGSIPTSASSFRRKPGIAGLFCAGKLGPCLGGETGIRSGLKIRRGRPHAGSSPAPGTIESMGYEPI